MKRWSHSVARMRGRGRGLGFRWMRPLEAVSVRCLDNEPPGRFLSRTSAVRIGRYLTEENFHAKVR